MRTMHVPPLPNDNLYRVPDVLHSERTVVAKAASTGTSSNWGGIVATPGGQVTEALMEYTIPWLTSNDCQGNNVAGFWTGIGGSGNGEPLGQDGTILNQANWPRNGAFYEVESKRYGYSTGAINAGISPPDAGMFKAQVDWRGTYYQFQMRDESAGSAVQSFTITPPFSGYATTGEYIAEPPSNYNLADFGTFQSNDVRVNGTYINQLSSSQREADTLSGTRGTASVGGINRQYGGFPITYQSCK